MPTTISVTDILNELAAASQRTDAPEGYQTIDELCLATGWGQSKLRRNLKLAQAAGRLQVARVMRPTLAGILQPVPVYRVTPVAKPKRKA